MVSKRVSQIESFKPIREETLDTVVLQLNPQGILFDASHTTCSEEDNILKRIGIELNKDMIITETWRYTLNFVDYIRGLDVPTISDKAKNQFVYNLEQLLNGKTNSFEIDARNEGKSSFLGEGEDALHIHIYGSKGKFSGNYTLTFSDQTAITKARDELAHTNKKLKKMAEIGEVTAMIMHEIRNMLVSMGGGANLLTRRLKHDTRLSSVAENMYKNTQKVESIITDSLAYIREPVLRKEEIDLTQLLSDINKDITSTRQGIYAASLETNFTKIPTIHGDNTKLTQVFYNLINNALEKNDSDKVLVSTYVNGSNAVVEVTDYGKPIPKVILPNLFTAYFTTKEKGTGLGLAISKNFIDAHNGEIIVDSDAKQTSFKVYLPLNKGI